MPVRRTAPKGKQLTELSTLPEQIQWVAANLGRNVARDLELIKGAFMPDGKALGFEELNPVERILQYINILYTQDAYGNLVLNQQGWYTWMDDVYTRMQTGIADALPADRKKYHLTDDDLRKMAVMSAIEYRNRMERLVAKTFPPELQQVQPASYPTETPGFPAPPLMQPGGQPLTSAPPVSIEGQYGTAI